MATARLDRLRTQLGAAPCADEDIRTPVCLVLGAGAGIGQGCAQKFAQEGFHVCIVRRGAGPNRLLRDEDDTKTKFEAFAQSLRDAVSAKAILQF